MLAYVLDSVRELLRVSRRRSNLLGDAAGDDPVPPAHLRGDRRPRAGDGPPGDASRTCSRWRRSGLRAAPRPRSRPSSAPKELRRSGAGRWPRPTVALRRGVQRRKGGGRSMSSDAAVPPVAPGGGAQVAETELKAGAIGFWGNMVQAVTHIAPWPERSARSDIHRQFRLRHGAARVPGRRHHLPGGRGRTDPAREAVHRRRRLLPVRQPDARSAARLAHDVAVLPVRPRRGRRRLRVHRLAGARHAQGAVRLEHPVVDHFRDPRRSA